MKPPLVVVLACVLGSPQLWTQSGFRPEIPKVWDESASLIGLRPLLV
jgi:hypothetical protein